MSDPPTGSEIKMDEAAHCEALADTFESVDTLSMEMRYSCNGIAAGQHAVALRAILAQNRRLVEALEALVNDTSFEDENEGRRAPTWETIHLARAAIEGAKL